MDEEQVKLPWFRTYSGIIDNDKIRLVAFEDRWHFIGILACKAQGILDIDAPNQMMRRRVAIKLGVQGAELDEISRRLAEVDLINKKSLQPLGWDRRQYRSDNSTERVRKHRENNESCNVTSPFPKHPDAATVTAPDTDTDTDSDSDTDTDSDADTERHRSKQTPPPILKDRGGKERKTKTRYVSGDLDIAKWIFNEILTMNPTAKPPNMPIWANQVRLMREQDQRDPDSIRSLFDWAHADVFWSTNILSPAKLRQHWDRLTMQRERAKKIKANPRESVAEQNDRLLREMYPDGPNGGTGKVIDHDG